MKRCGTEDGPGQSARLPGHGLLAQLRRLQEDGRFGPEIKRRERVERYGYSFIKRLRMDLYLQVVFTSSAEEFADFVFGRPLTLQGILDSAFDEINHRGIFQPACRPETL
jgi:hypothetical protein